MQLAQLAEMEVKHRCNQILELGFPLGGVAKLFAQDWEGDITVVMPATLAQVKTDHSFLIVVQIQSHMMVWFGDMGAFDGFLLILAFVVF